MLINTLRHLTDINTTRLLDRFYHDMDRHTYETNYFSKDSIHIFMKVCRELILHNFIKTRSLTFSLHGKQDHNLHCSTVTFISLTLAFFYSTV